MSIMSNFLLVVNSSTNLIIYCAKDQKFRKVPSNHCSFILLLFFVSGSSVQAWNAKQWTEWGWLGGDGEEKIKNHVVQSNKFVTSDKVQMIIEEVKWDEFLGSWMLEAEMKIMYNGSWNVEVNIYSNIYNEYKTK